MSTLLFLVAATLLALAGAAIWWALATRRQQQQRSSRLPAGADAALWSIVEVVPDPRNHLALTRDLTGEVRIAGTPLDTWQHPPGAERWDQAS